MTQALTTQTQADIMERVLIAGDLSKLSPADRVNYYGEVCKSVGLNPLTKPFDYINLSGRLTLYAKKDAADQLRRINSVSIVKVEREHVGDVYIVTAYAQDATGRQDSDVGAVNVAGLKGDALANAIMKAHTKAKRRVTLSISGLGWLDETEIETIPDARPVTVNTDTGEIVKSTAPAPRIVVERQPEPQNGAQQASTQQAQDPPGFAVWADWRNANDAKAWAMTQGKFNAQQHMERGYEKCKADCKPETAREMWQCWWKYVTEHAPAKAQAAHEAATDFDGIDTSDTDPVTAGDWLDG